jgi:hypothetical protein
MATVPSSQERIAPETQQRIYSPLHKLRGTIRRYIGWEALALCLTLLGAWFWLGLVLDYGAFKLAGVDWVQVLPRTARWVLLIAVAGGFIVLMAMALARLLRQFRPEALALVLERRFPDLLGDKLITAVELSDLDRAEEFGYSRAMILENVRDVSNRVDQIPVSEVFNWRRLYRRWINVALLTIGFMVLVTLIFLVWRRTTNVADFGYRFADISGIWFERNILMHDVLWPRRSMLEIVEFPETGEMRIGRDAPSPRIRARALKWVVADADAPEGWRSMTWADLKPEFLEGGNPPTLPTALLVQPAESQSAPAASSSFWTLDRVEMLLDQEEVRKRFAAPGAKGDDVQALRDVYSRLDKTAELAAMSRKLRKLIVPKEVRIYYWGAKTSDEAPMSSQQQGVNEFSAILSDLKESVKFYIKGEDYTTYPYRRITLVPPPTLTRLEKDEYLPAYQYYRLPADGGIEDLKGKKQVRLGQGVSLTGGTSRIEIASGSDLVLRGEVDKDLAAANIRYRTANGKKTEPAAGSGVVADAGKVEALEVGADKHSIRKEFMQITQPIEFDFEFTDTDNVKSLRHIIIQPIEDKTPDVNVSVEVIRRTPSGYMCTAQAMIPFSGTIRDDFGLSKVEYSVAYSRVESLQVLGLRAGVAAGILGMASASPCPRELLGAPGLAEFFGRLSESREAVVTLPPLSLQSFIEIAADKDREFRYGKEQLPAMLQNPPANLDDLRRLRMIGQFDLKPNLEFLDLQERVKDLQRGLDETIRPRYRMRLTIQAVDNNVETGPRVGQNKETFTFLVVPYEELLAEMNKDEEALAYKAQDLDDKVRDVRSTLEKVIERMPREPGSDDFRSSVSRMEEMLGELDKGSDVAREMLSDAARLLKEAQTNRLPQNFVDTKEKLSNLLDEAIRNQFERAKEAHAALRDVMQTRQPPEPAVVALSRQRQDELIRQIDQILELVRKAIDITNLAKNLGEVIKGREEAKIYLDRVLQDEKDKTYAELGQLTPNNQPIELARGEKKIVTIDLGRDEFVPGRLVVKFQAPQDSEIGIPPSVNVLRLVKTIQVEIAAGNKPGTFEVPVTIVPSGGEKAIRTKGDVPFVLKVIVK